MTFLIIVAALSVLLGGARGLNEMRDKAVDVFENGGISGRVNSLFGKIVSVFDKNKGETDSYYSLAKKINDLSACAETIIRIAEKHLPSGDSDLKELRIAVSALKKATTVEDKLSYNDILTQSSENIRYKVALGTGDADYAAWTIAYNDMKSHLGTMSGNSAEYNRLAEDFNKRLSGFPANIITLIGLTEKLPVYSAN